MATEQKLPLESNWKVTYEFIDDEFKIKRAVIAVTAKDAVFARATALDKLGNEIGRGKVRITKVEAF